MVVSLAKLFIGILISFLIFRVETYTLPQANFPMAINKSQKNEALQILEDKCNVCHRKRNKRGVFTSSNMNHWSKDIYKQVFIKKRMPKGKKTKLTNSEYQKLLTWITSIKN